MAGRALSSLERAVVEKLLEQLPGGATATKSVEDLRVTGTCGCGCPSIDFEHANQRDGIAVVAEVAVIGTPDVIMLFADAHGRLASLEYLAMSDEPPQSFSPVDGLRLMGT